MVSPGWTVPRLVGLVLVTRQPLGTAWLVIAQVTWAPRGVVTFPAVTATASPASSVQTQPASSAS